MVQKEENVVIFPFMAQGHMIPFLSLALQIEQKKGFTVTLVNTPLNIEKLRHSIPSTSTIRLVSLPFSAADHGLPPEAENTDVLPYPLIIRPPEAENADRRSCSYLFEHRRRSRALPFNEGSFDFVVSTEMIDDVRIPARMVLEMERVLRSANVGIVMRRVTGNFPVTTVMKAAAPVAAFLRFSDVVAHWVGSFLLKGKIVY